MSNLVAQQGAKMGDLIGQAGLQGMQEKMQQYGIDVQNLTSEDIAQIQAATQGNAQANQLEATLADIAARQNQFGLTNTFNWGNLGANLYLGGLNNQLGWGTLGASLGLSPAQIAAIVGGNTPTNAFVP